MVLAFRTTSTKTYKYCTYRMYSISYKTHSLPSYIRQFRLEIDGSINRLMHRVNYPQYNIRLKVLKLHSVTDSRIIGLIGFQHKADLSLS